MCKLPTKSCKRLKRMWNMEKGEKNIRSQTNKKTYHTLEVRKFVKNSAVTTTYEMISLIKELKTVRELQRESLTNLTSKPHAELDPKKNLQPQINKAEDPHTKKKKIKLNPNNNKPQASLLSPPNPITLPPT